MDLRLPVFVYATGVGGLVLLPVLWTQSQWTGPLEVALLCLTAIPLGLMGVNIRGITIFADFGPQLAAYLFFGAAPAALLRMAVEAASALQRRRPWYKVWFNVGHIVISVAGADLILRLLGLSTGGGPAAGLTRPGALLAAALGFAVFQTIINLLFVDLVLYLAGERSTLWVSFRPGSEESRWQWITAVITVPAGVAYAGMYMIWGVGGALVMTLLTLGTGWLLNRYWLLHQRAQALQDLASRDPLTGLYNRARLMDLLKENLAACAAAGRSLALLFIDLDGFGEFNDRHGHLDGDRVLTEVAQSLKERVGTRGTAARYAGDEFVVLLPGFGSPEAEAAAAEIREGLAPVHCSVGVAVYPVDGDDPLSLLDVADRRMYRTKGRSLFEPDGTTMTAVAGIQRASDQG